MFRGRQSSSEVIGETSQTLLTSECLVGPHEVNDQYRTLHCIVQSIISIGLTSVFCIVNNNKKDRRLPEGQMSKKTADKKLFYSEVFFCPKVLYTPFTPVFIK